MKGVVCLILSLMASTIAQGASSDSVVAKTESPAAPARTALKLELPKSSAGTAVEMIPNVAVLSFTGSDVESEVLARASSRFERMLSRTDAFDVMPRRELDGILRKKGFRVTGVCEDTRCMVDMGRLLGADGVVAGDLSRRGDGWVFTILYIEVSTGRVAFNHVMDIDGGLGNVLDRGCREMVALLDGERKPQSNRTFIAARGIRHWPWIVGGVAAAGALATAAVLLLGDDESSSDGERTTPSDQMIVRW